MTPVVLFDIDETLIGFRGSVDDAFRAHLAEVAPQAAVDGAWAHWESLGQRYYRRFLAGELSFAEQRRHRTRAFCAGLRIPLGPSEEAADQWLGAFLDRCEELLWAFPDVRPALRTLRAAGYRFGALSNNAHANQHRRLRLVGLREELDALVCCDDVGGLAKPDPRTFHAACRAMGVEPEEAVYIGDDLDVDAQGATAAGLRGYWLNRGGLAARAFPRTVTGLEELARELVG
jgi:putative hydrolase of the HAD superfamily